MRRLPLLLPFSARGWPRHPPPIDTVLWKTAHRRLNAGGLTNLYDEAQAPALQVRNASDRGIELEDGLVYASACILLGGQSFSWRVPGPPWVGWSSETFEIFNVVSPKPGWSLALVNFRSSGWSAYEPRLDRAPPSGDRKKSSSPTALYTRVSQEIRDSDGRHGHGECTAIQTYARLISDTEKCVFNIQFIV
jgi:hypothetical protein